METLSVELWTFDVGVSAGTPEAYVSEMISRVLESWDAGADVVVFPEYAWMGLAKFVDRKDDLRGVADLFWSRLWPELRGGLRHPAKAAVLGTVPFVEQGGLVKNRAPIIADGRELYQDKLFLTPWEAALTAGDSLHLWKFRGYTFAVLTCFDIEMPEIAAALRGRGVDCLLVPSATETELGMERVGRCASARSVELGCYVGVAHVVGRGPSDIVDENVGRLAWFAPSQAAFIDEERQTAGAVLLEGFARKRGRLSSGKLVAMRSTYAETNPSHERGALPKIKLVTW